MEFRFKKLRRDRFIMAFTMISFEEYSNYIEKIVHKHNFDNVVSIYAYGGITQGNFDPKYSDIDLWFVIKYNSIEERLGLVKKMIKVFGEGVKEYIAQFVDNENNTLSSPDSSRYFSEEEFKLYCNIFPTRVLYHLKKGVFKKVYGKEILENVKIPTRYEYIEQLQYDFEIFSETFYSFGFTLKTRTMIKNFLRALKKAIWILEDNFLICKDDVLEKADSILKDDILLISVIKRIRKLKENDYNIFGYEYLELYTDCSKILAFYGGKIKNYILKNNYKLLNQKEYSNSTLWGTAIGEFTYLISQYCLISENDRIKFLNILGASNDKKLKFGDYFDYMKYFNYILTNDLKIKEVRLRSTDITFKKNHILETNKLKNDIYLYIRNLEGYKFLIDEHRKNLLFNKFELMKTYEIMKYIESLYIPAIYEVYTHLLF
jgi:hypothetical protein